MQRTFIPYLLGVLLLASGCLPAMTTPVAEPIQPPPVTPLREDQFSDDMKLVTAAVVERMRGSGRAVPGVTFAPSGVHEVEEADFHYENFYLAGMGVTAYAAGETRPGVVTAKLEGILNFKDLIDRSASVFFSAEYTVTRNGLVIANSAVLNLAPVAPVIETYFVPADRLKAARDRLTSYTDYYLFALDKAAPMTPEGSQGTTRPKDDYIIMAFCKDRLLPVSSLDMRVTANRGMHSRKVAETAYIYEQGWRIMLAGGEFRPGSAANRFYVNVEYLATPAPGAEPLLLATFENKKLPAPTARSAPPAPGPTAPAAATQTRPAAEGPLGSGTVFLDLTRPSDVKLIQQRFKELGLYTQAVDGAIGPGTRRAFDVFADRYNLQRGLWTIDMQKLLFQGSGR
jgi:hypothetical protein